MFAKALFRKATQLKQIANYSFGTNAANASTSSTERRTVVLFEGNGIGPEIAKAVQEVFEAAKVPIDWEMHQIHTKVINKEGDLIHPDSLEAVKKHKFGLKGPFETPIGKGFRSLNVTLRKRLQLYANVRPCLSLEGVKTKYNNVDVVTIRENTEGEYSGLEHEVVPGVVENLKIISEQACRNISEYAFQFARTYGRKRVTACHKAGIMKLGDGLFIRICKEVSLKYPEIAYNEEQIDTVCYKLAKEPGELDVMVMPNLYGDIVSDLCSGLIGGLGVTPSGNIGKDCAIYEAVHGTAPDIAGKNLANPTALLFSGVMMLTQMQLKDHSQRISNAILKTLKEQKYITRDLGGKATTTEYVKALIGNLD